MAYQPQFSISPKLLGLVEAIAVLRERIQSASVELAWIPALKKDTRTRNVHASTAIEGNPLTLEQVRALEEGRELERSDARSKREVLNYFAGLRYIERHLDVSVVRHDDVFELHRILADQVMDQGEPGRYRTIAVRVGDYLPPVAQDVSGLMFELLDWWNREALELSPVLSSAILHYRFEAIHPFADGNGRTGRALALWELYRRGFDTHHIFSVDEYYWEDRPAYYQALRDVRVQDEDLTTWLEYSARGLREILERVWQRVQTYQMKAPAKFALRPKQEELLRLLKERGGMPPAEIWKALDVSKQGALNLLNPLIEIGLVQRVGTRKKGYYQLVEDVT
jgi:Fic family protein